MIVFVLIWIRATFPRMRYDQLMSIGWKVLIPVALLNIIVTGAVILGMVLRTGGVVEGMKAWSKGSQRP